MMLCTKMMIVVNFSIQKEKNMINYTYYKKIVEFSYDLFDEEKS